MEKYSFKTKRTDDKYLLGCRDFTEDCNSGEFTNDGKKVMFVVKDNNCND